MRGAGLLPRPVSTNVDQLAAADANIINVASIQRPTSGRERWLDRMGLGRPMKLIRQFRLQFHHCTIANSQAVPDVASGRGYC